MWVFLGRFSRVYRDPFSSHGSKYNNLSLLSSSTKALMLEEDKLSNTQNPKSQRSVFKLTLMRRLLDFSRKIFIKE